MRRTPRYLPVVPYFGLQPLLNGEGGGGTGAGTGTGGTGGAGQGQGGGPDTGQGGTGQGGGQGGTGTGQDTRTFTQADVERIIGERLARERDRYKDYEQLQAKASELDKLKESQASESEKAMNQVRKDTEAAVRGQLEPRINRLEAALKYGLPEDLGAKVLSAAKRLVGDTPEELEADAREFFTTSPITIATGGNGDGGGGGANLDQGVRGGSGGSGGKGSVASGRDLYRELLGKGKKT